MTENNTKSIDYLTEDNPLSGQTWVCLSFLSPEGITNCKIRGLKVRGVFATQEEAQSRAKHLHNIDPDFDVFVGEVGKWLPWNPDPTDVQEEVFAEKELNDLMKKYKENREQSRLEEETRKKELLSTIKKPDSSSDSSDKKMKIKERLQQKLNEKKQLNQEEVDKSKEKLDEVTNELNDKLKEVQSLDQNLKKIKNLYDKVQTKKQNE